MVVVSVSASGGTEIYHTNEDCIGLAKSKTRRVARHKIPNSRLCKRCDKKEWNQTEQQQQYDILDFIEDFDATDIERGELAEAVREECE